MLTRYDIAIIGGGPAGASAAITLARAGYAILLLEAKASPHDTLCGEFLSPECQGWLRQLGVAESVRALSPTTIRAASLIADDNTRWAAPLPGLAWGLSRAKLDQALLQAAATCGATVHERKSCVGVAGNLRDGFTLTTRRQGSAVTQMVQARVVIGAHGKRSTMDRTLGRAFLGQSYPLFAMKRHFRGALPPEGVALCGFAGGYCGLGAIEGGLVNLCFLADRRMFQRTQHVQDFLTHLSRANPTLGAWLREAQALDEPWQSVGALRFGAKGCVERDVLLVGDAAGLIAPLAGDGIAMALHSGWLCAQHAQSFLQGDSASESLKTNYTRAWGQTFLPRIRLAGWLQTLMLRPLWMRMTLRLFQRAPSLGQWMVTHTRGM